MAFYALLSLFPAIIAGVSIYGLVADPATVQNQINELTTMLSPSTADLIGEQLKQVTSGAGGALGVATVIGILTALWSASSGMKAMITGVNLAYDESEGRKFVKLRGLALVLTLGAMLLMGVALTLIVGFPALADSWPTALRWTVGILRWVLLAALLIGALAVLYRFAPDRDEPSGPVSWGRDRHPAVDPASIGFSVYATPRQLQQDLRGPGRGHHPDVLALPDAVIVLIGAELNTRWSCRRQGHHRRPTKPMGDRAHAADHVRVPSAGR